MARAKSTRELADYRSPKHKLLAFFKERRDAWKAKCLHRGGVIKALRGRVADLSESRDAWKQRAKAAEAELARVKKAGSGTHNALVVAPVTLSAPTVLGPTLDQSVPAYHHFPISVIMLAVMLVATAAISLRGSSSALRLMRDSDGAHRSTPSFWTIRIWMQKLGYLKLIRKKPRATDWVWMADHTMQIGPDKCLLIVGLRLANLPARGVPLGHEHMEPLALIPMKHSNGRTVAAEFGKLAQRTGVPRQIVADEGSDMRAGVALFRTKHPGTVYIYDIRHKAARLLKASLGSDPRWEKFCQQAAKTRRLLQQTDLAALIPPSQRSKARYMNVGPLTAWGTQIVAVVQSRQRVAFRETSISKAAVRKRLGWVMDYAEALRQWHETATIAQSVDEHVQRNGIDTRSRKQIVRSLRRRATTKRGRRMRADLLAFVEQEAAKARPGERLVGSTAVLESVFGKLKHLERNQSGGGFTGMLLAAVACIGSTTVSVVKHAFETVRAADVSRWCHERLGMSPQAKRRRILSAVGGTKSAGKA